MNKIKKYTTAALGVGLGLTGVLGAMPATVHAAEVDKTITYEQAEKAVAEAQKKVDTLKAALAEKTTADKKAQEELKAATASLTAAEMKLDGMKDDLAFYSDAANKKALEDKLASLEKRLEVNKTTLEGLEGSLANFKASAGSIDHAIKLYQNVEDLQHNRTEALRTFRSSLKDADALVFDRIVGLEIEILRSEYSMLEAERNTKEAFHNYEIANVNHEKALDAGKDQAELDKTNKEQVAASKKYEDAYKAYNAELEKHQALVQQKEDAYLTGSTAIGTKDVVYRHATAVAMFETHEDGLAYYEAKKAMNDGLIGKLETAVKDYSTYYKNRTADADVLKGDVKKFDAAEINKMKEAVKKQEGVVAEVNKTLTTAKAAAEKTAKDVKDTDALLKTAEVELKDAKAVLEGLTPETKPDTKPEAKPDTKPESKPNKPVVPDTGVEGTHNNTLMSVAAGSTVLIGAYGSYVFMKSIKAKKEQ